MYLSVHAHHMAERFEENGAMYHWPGVKASDIVSDTGAAQLLAGELTPNDDHKAYWKSQDANGGRKSHSGIERRRDRRCASRGWQRS